MIFNANQLPDGTNRWTKHNLRITISQRLFHKESPSPKKNGNDKENNVTYTYNSFRINKYINILNKTDMLKTWSQWAWAQMAFPHPIRMDSPIVLINIIISNDGMCYTMLCMLEWMRKGKHRIGTSRIQGLRGSALTAYIHGGIP